MWITDEQKEEAQREIDNMPKELKRMKIRSAAKSFYERYYNKPCPSSTFPHAYIFHKYLKSSQAIVDTLRAAMFSDMYMCVIKYGGTYISGRWGGVGPGIPHGVIISWHKHLIKDDSLNCAECEYISECRMRLCCHMSLIDNVECRPGRATVKEK